MVRSFLPGDKFSVTKRLAAAVRVGPVRPDSAPRPASPAAANRIRPRAWRSAGN